MHVEDRGQLAGVVLSLSPVGPGPQSPDGPALWQVPLPAESSHQPVLRPLVSNHMSHVFQDGFASFVQFSRKYFETCSSGLPQTEYITEDDLKLVVLLPLSLKCWDYRYVVALVYAWLIQS